MKVDPPQSEAGLRNQLQRKRETMKLLKKAQEECRELEHTLLGQDSKITINTSKNGKFLIVKEVTDLRDNLQMGKKIFVSYTSYEGHFFKRPFNLKPSYRARDRYNFIFTRILPSTSHFSLSVFLSHYFLPYNYSGIIF